MFTLISATIGKQLGNTMLNKHLSSFAPSIRALSKVELGIPLMNCIIKKILSAPPPKKAGTIKGFKVPSNQPHSAYIKYKGIRKVMLGNIVEAMVTPKINALYLNCTFAKPYAHKNAEVMVPMIHNTTTVKVLPPHLMKEEK